MLRQESYVVGGRMEDKKRDSGAVDLSSLTGIQLLQTIHAGKMVPPLADILRVSTTDSVTHAFRLLAAHKISSLPVYDKRKHRYVAFIDTLDLVASLVESLGEAALPSGDLLAALEARGHREHETCGEVANASKRNHFYSVQNNAPLLAAIQTIVSQRVHRIAVINHESELHTIITQTDVARFVHNNMTQFLDLKNKTIGELFASAHKPVTGIANDKRALDAFMLLHKTNHAGIAVTTPEDPTKLSGNLSASDLLSCVINGRIGSDVLQLPIYKFLKLIPDEPDVSHLELITATAKNTFAELLDKFVKLRIHRVYIVEEGTNKLSGLVSLYDVCHVLVQYAEARPL